MPAVQTTYTETQAAAFIGMIANSEPRNVLSRLLEGAAGFGVPVIQGIVSDQGVRAVAAGTYAAVAGAVVGTGNGVVTMGTPSTNPGVLVGQYGVTFIEPITNLGTFEVEDPNGVVVGTGVVGTIFNGPVRFTVADGATDFLAGDRIPITVTASAFAPLFRGVTVKDPTVPPANADAFIDKDVIPVMERGVIWVTASVAVTPGQPLYFTTAGAWTNIPGTSNVLVPNGIWESSAAPAALAKIRLK